MAAPVGRRRSVDARAGRLQLRLGCRGSSESGAHHHRADRRHGRALLRIPVRRGERDTDRTIPALHFVIPTGWFQSLNPAYVITFAPVFAWAWVALAKRHLNP